jgi:hypothetical protein
MTWDLLALLLIQEEGVPWIFIALKNPLPWQGLNTQPSTTTPPRRLPLFTLEKYQLMEETHMTTCRLIHRLWRVYIQCSKTSQISINNAQHITCSLSFVRECVVCFSKLGQISEMLQNPSICSSLPGGTGPDVGITNVPSAFCTFCLRNTDTLILWPCKKLSRLYLTVCISPIER